MGLFDEIKSQVLAALGGSAGGQEAASSDIVGHVTEFLRQHGLGNLLQQFQEKGMGKVVSSWVGKEANLPISVEQLQHALGPDAIANFAAKFGIPPEQTAALLARILPHVVDQMTPNGLVEEGAAAAGPGSSPPSSRP